MTCQLCGDPDSRLYPAGQRCDRHSPAAIAGRTVPTPDPDLTLLGLRQAAGLPPWPGVNLSSSTLNDDRAIETGKRRSTPAQFREARARQDARRAADKTARTSH